MPEIPLQSIIVSSQNTRKDLKQGEEDVTLQDLANSIHENGLLNAIHVRETAPGQYEVIAGQRRYLAHKLLQKETIKAEILQDVSDQQATVISLIENLQRADMSPYDKAAGFQRLLQQYGNLDRVVKEVGITKATIQRYLKLLTLPEEVLKDFTVSKGSASIQVGATLADVFKNNPEDMEEAYEKIKQLPAEKATLVIKDSAGDIDLLEEKRDEVVMGTYNFKRCGYNLSSCPYIPDNLRKEILELAGE